MSAPWWETPLIGFDTETTGADPTEARLVTACVVLDRPGAERHVRNWLVAVDEPIPDEATAVHGITTEQAQTFGRPAAEVVPEIIETLMARRFPIVAYNASFDFTILDRECRRLGIEPIDPHPVIDPFILDKQIDRYRKGSRRLADVVAHYGGRLDAAHTADADATAAVWLARAIGRHRPHPPADADALHLGQIIWRRDQCASLQTFLRRNDPDAIVDPTWPVQPAPAGVPA